MLLVTLSILYGSTWSVRFATRQHALANLAQFIPTSLSFVGRLPHVLRGTHGTHNGCSFARGGRHSPRSRPKLRLRWWCTLGMVNQGGSRLRSRRYHCSTGADGRRCPGNGLRLPLPDRPASRCAVQCSDGWTEHRSKLPQAGDGEFSFLVVPIVQDGWLLV
eukprot:SAG31_NODE_3965_length_3709_cov_19.967590_4_plen_162_part_00